MVEWVKWFVMDCMGERVSDGSIVVMVFSWRHGSNVFFMCGMGEIVCNGWQKVK